MARLTHTLDTEQITVSLRLPRAFGIRAWLTARLIQIARLVAPFTIEIEVASDKVSITPAMPSAPATIVKTP